MMAEQRVFEEQEIRVPPYYERFLEERDRRLSSEIARLETEVRHNRQRIDELKADNASQHEELKADIARLDGKTDEGHTDLDGKIERLRAELKADIARLDSKLDSHFRWMLTLLLPVILGVVALLIQNLLR